MFSLKTKPSENVRNGWLWKTKNTNTPSGIERDAENTQREEKKKSFSMFWMYFFMMLCILVLAVLVQVFSNRILLKNLVEENLSNMQITLGQECKQFSTALYNTSAIPGAIENSRYYDMIRAEKSTSLQPELMAVMQGLRTSLFKQSYLQGDNEECILYFPNINSICRRLGGAATAEQLFEEQVIYSETEPDTILELLDQSHTVTFLPMQEVTINGRPICCLTLIIRLMGDSVSVMTLYNEEQILSFFGIGALPEETHLELLSSDGTALMQYPGPVTEEVRERGYRLTCNTAQFDMDVNLYIPQDYFRNLVWEAEVMGYGMTILVMVIGIILCFWLSRISMQPVWKLVSEHNDEFRPLNRQNEMVVLGTILTESKQEALNLKQRLASNTLIRAFSGTVLSDEDIQNLDEISCKMPYRVAILHIDALQYEQDALFEEIEQALDGYQHTLMNKRDIGVLLADREEDLETIRSLQKRLCADYAHSGAKISIGISMPFSSFEDFHTFLRQARVAITDSAVRVFNGEIIGKKKFSWVQNERFYQSILDNDQEKAIEILRVIATHTDEIDAEVTFYHVQFILRCVMDELQLPIGKKLLPQYNPSMLAHENIRGLERIVRAVFWELQEIQTSDGRNGQEQVKQYLQSQYRNPSMCIALAAEELQISEKKLAQLIRQFSDQTFNEYLVQLRMKQAGRLLTETEKKVGDIAEECGYPSESTFFRVFKKYYGITPAQYRKLRQSSQTL